MILFESVANIGAIDVTVLVVSAAVASVVSSCIRCTCSLVVVAASFSLCLKRPLMILFASTLNKKKDVELFNVNSKVNWTLVRRR